MDEREYRQASPTQQRSSQEDIDKRNRQPVRRGHGRMRYWRTSRSRYARAQPTASAYAQPA